MSAVTSRVSRGNGYVFENLAERRTAMARRIMRALDVGLATASVLITAPVLVLTAILVYLETPGPVFARYRSVGKDGRPFTLFRFRTRPLAPEPLQGSEAPAPYTRVGTVIHRLYIDELPQLLNIVRGEMSLVDRKRTVPRKSTLQPPPGAKITSRIS
jgi:lipopolysaccharide/colanic/teichoic acid biosynthesis glycosyltransferase